MVISQWEVFFMVWFGVTEIENRKMDTILFNNNVNFVPALLVSGSFVVSIFIAIAIIISIIISVIIITPPGMV